MAEESRKKGLKLDFPKGCKDCNANSNWQCENGCLWPENYWKYDELMKYYVLAQWSKAGLDLNRIEQLIPEDFLKISFIKKLL